MPWKNWQPFRWLNKGKGKKPQPAKHIRRWAHFDLEFLEKRWLFSTSPWLPRNPILIEGAANFNQDPMVSPLGLVPNPQNYNNPNVTANFQVSGSFTFDDNGVYTFQLHMTGSNATNCMTFDETGTSTFNLHQAGTFSNGSDSFNSFALNQNAVTSWHFLETDHSGHTIQNTSSHDTFTTNDTAPLFGDNFHWYGFNWYDLALTPSNLHTLNLTAYSWSSLAVNETGTFSLFTYQEIGTTTFTESAATFNADNDLSRPPGGLPAVPPVGDPSGGLSAQRPGGNLPGGDAQTTATLSFAFSRTANYTYTDTSNGTLTLHEVGTYGSSSFSLSSVLYKETGSKDTYALTEKGTDTVSGTGTLTTSALVAQGLESGTYSATNTFTSSDLANYTYTENATGTHTASEAGTYGNSAFNLPTVKYSQTGSGTMSFLDTQTQSFSGNGSSTSNTSGALVNADNYSYQTYSSNSTFTTNERDAYSFTGGGTLSYNATGTATSFSALETGSFSGGKYAVNSLTFTDNGTAVSTLQATNTASFNGNGTVTTNDTGLGNGSSNQGGTSSGGSGNFSSNSTAAYNFGGLTTLTTNINGTWNFNLNAPGSYSNGTYNLSSLTDSGNGPGSFTLQLNGYETMSGTVSNNDSAGGSNNGTLSGYGGATATAFGSYGLADIGTSTYGSGVTFVASASGTDTYSSNLAGSFANGSWSLNSVLFQDNAKSTSTFQEFSTQTYSGNGTMAGSFTGNGNGCISYGGATNSQTNTGNSYSNQSFNANGTITDSATITSSDTYSYYGAGTFTSGRYSLTSLVVTDSGLSTLTALGTATDSMSGSGFDTVTLGDGGVNLYTLGYYTGNSTNYTLNTTNLASYTYNGTDTQTFNASSSDSYSAYLAGTYGSAVYNLSSAVFQHGGTATSGFGGSSLETLTSTGTLSETDVLPGTNTVNYAGDNTGATGTLIRYSTNTYTDTGTASSTYSGGTGPVSFTSYQAGQWANGSFSFSSVVFQDNGTLTWNAQAQSIDTVTSGGGLATGNYNGNGTYSSNFGGATASSNGTSNGLFTSTYTFTSTESATYTDKGTDTFSVYLAGSYANASYAFISVVLSDNVSSTATLTDQGLATFNGNSSSASTFTTSGGITETLGYTGDHYTGNLTYTETANATYNSTDCYTVTDVASDSFTFYRAGSFAQNSYNLSSLVFNDQGGETRTLSAAGTTTDTAAGTAVATGYNTYTSNTTYGFHTQGTTNNSNFARTFFYNSGDQETYTANGTSTDSFSNYEAGSFANGSAGFSSVSFLDQSSDTFNLSSTLSSSYSGTVTQTYNRTSTDNPQVSYGYLMAGGNFTSTFSSNDCATYSTADSLTFGESFNHTSTFSASGSYQFGDYNLSSLVLQDSGNSTDTLSLSASDTYTGLGNSMLTMIGGGSANFSYGYGMGGGSSNITFTDKANYSFTANECVSATGTSTASHAYYQAGSYGHGVHSFNSVVFADQGTDSLGYGQGSTWTYSGTQTITSTQSASTSSGLGGSGGPDSVSGTLAYAYSHTDVYSNSDTYSYSQGNLDSFTNYQAGCFSNGLYAYTSAVFQATGTVPWTFHHYSNDTITSTGNLTVTIYETFTVSLSCLGNTETGQGGHYDFSTDASSFTASNVSTFDSTGLGTFNGYSAGCFANGSYSFASYTYQAAGLGTFNLTVNDTQINTDTYTDQANDSSVFQVAGNGYSSIETNNYSTTENATFTGRQTYTENSLKGGTTYSVYEAGSYGNHSFSLISVLFQETGSWTADSNFHFTQTQNGSSTSSWTDTGQATMVVGGSFGGGVTTLTGNYNDTGNTSDTFNATVCLSYDPQHAFNSFTSYQAGSWSNGCYSFASVTYDGNGNQNWSMTSNETWNASGSASDNVSSSGILTSGAQGNYNSTFNSNYFFHGSGSGNGNYTLHEEGNFGNGTYSLGCLNYSVSGSANNSDTYNGADTYTGTGTMTTYNFNDSYSGSASGNAGFSLTQFGQYASGIWTINQFTLSENTYTNASYNRSGNFSSSGPSGSSSGNFSYSYSAGSTFNLYEVGSYANGSFSFVTFSCTDSGQANSGFQESGQNAAYSSYSETDTMNHSFNLVETGQNQTGVYTLTISDSWSHTFYAQPRMGPAISYSSSGSLTTTTHGNFSLAGGNPYLPYGGLVPQANGAGVGINIGWVSSGTGAGQGDTSMGAGGHRVTSGLSRVQAERVEPQQTNPEILGLPPSTSDEPNLGLPVGASGLAGIDPNGNSSPYYMPTYATGGSSNSSLLVPSLKPPQQAPNNGPYHLSTQQNAFDCMCAGVQSFGHWPYLGGLTGGMLVPAGGSGANGSGSNDGIVLQGQLIAFAEVDDPATEKRKALRSQFTPELIDEVRARILATADRLLQGEDLEIAVDRALAYGLLDRQYKKNTQYFDEKVDNWAAQNKRYAELVSSYKKKLDKEFWLVVRSLAEMSEFGLEAYAPETGFFFAYLHAKTGNDERAKESLISMAIGRGVTQAFKWGGPALRGIGGKLTSLFSKETKVIYVIGRRPDTLVAKEWVGYEILDIADWSFAKNDAWIQSIIKRRAKVYVASPVKGNVWNADKGCETVFGRELRQLQKAGYKRVGDYMVPPD